MVQHVVRLGRVLPRRYPRLRLRSGAGMNEVQMAAKLRAQAHRIEASREAGEELIAAAREVVAAWYGPTPRGKFRRVRNAIFALEQLVGRPSE